MGRKRWLVAILAALSTFIGCGKAPPPPIVEVEGVVLLDGRPLNNVEVRFIPAIAYGAEYLAKGITDRQGRYKLTCKGKDGACAGENHVLVKEAEIPARLKGENAQAELAIYLQGLGDRPLPPRYADLGDNPLVANVTAEQKEYNFELTR